MRQGVLRISSRCGCELVDGLGVQQIEGKYGPPDTCVGGSRTSGLQGACHLRGSPLKWSVLPLRFHGENGQHRRFSDEVAAAAERGSPATLGSPATPGSPGTGGWPGGRCVTGCAGRRPSRPGRSTVPDRAEIHPGRHVWRSTRQAAGRWRSGRRGDGSPEHISPGSRAARTPFRSPPGSWSLKPRNLARERACPRSCPR